MNVLVLTNREGTEIKIGPYLAHHHAYITEIIDQKVVEEQARRRAEDKRHPESTVLHFHKAHEGCNGNQHEKYEVKPAE